MLLGAVLFVEIALFASLVPLLSRLPIRRLQRFVKPACNRSHQMLEHAGEARIIRCTETVCRLGRRFIRRRCMTRGLTLYFFLQRAGIDVSLVFGVGEIKENAEGHCWLERHGVPFLEATDPRLYFTPMYSFGGSLSRSTRPGRDVV